MLNILEVSNAFGNQWVVLDRSRRVVDHGADFDVLYRKHSGSGKTFYFACAL